MSVPQRILGKRVKGIPSFAVQYLKPTISLFLSRVAPSPHPCSDCCGHPPGSSCVLCIRTKLVWVLSPRDDTLLDASARLCSSHSLRQPEERLDRGHWSLIGQTAFLASESSLLQELSCSLVDTKAQRLPQSEKKQQFILRSNMSDHSPGTQI